MKYRIMIPVFIATLFVMTQACYAQKVSDVANTKHNLSVTGSGSVGATVQTQICAFCHTPHGATNFPGSPLWNRQLSTSTYTVYTSASLDAEDISGQLEQPGGSSKLCLSCHDGTLAIGTVNVLGGIENPTISMSGTAADGSMPAGSGTGTGFTRDLGIDLLNDHPISMTFDTTLATTDGELYDPVAASHIAVGAPGIRPPVPLEATGPGMEAQVQCASCHDPHMKDLSLSVSSKFLRLNRFQQSSPVTGTFTEATDIVCLACHNKAGWSESAHATIGDAAENYTSAAAALREFPTDITVWQAACLNCHDPHTVHGARRLLREGTDSPASPKSSGDSAIEETCFQCHTAAPIINNTAGEVPDIEIDFNRLRHMPIDNVDQVAGTEQHDISSADLAETRLLLGRGDHNNRHTECTDCHNPHRVMKNRLFNGSGLSTAGTHDHNAPHTNIASGVLRGIWGVEPVYGSSTFLSRPNSYLLKEGDPGTGASTSVNSPYVTREYQVCLKCHSDYGFNDDDVYPIGSRPDLGVSGGGTLLGTNDLDQYTNQAMEFQPPSGDRGEPGGNHRSWHPVVDSTGRTLGIRDATAGAFLAPFNSNIGNLTMYCTDCHGSNTANNSVEPAGGENGNAWGPHGSANNFILKGTWDGQTGGNSRDVPATDPNNGLCFKCHDFRTYADRNGDDDNDSGFSGNKSNNLHAFHADEIESMHCSWCHTAVPHGWKNKALLVNLNDVGAEAGLPAGTEVNIRNNNEVFTQGPYYMNAKLKIRTFATSGNWDDNNCGSASNQQGNSKNWMGNVCENPP